MSDFCLSLEIDLDFDLAELPVTEGSRRIVRQDVLALNIARNCQDGPIQRFQLGASVFTGTHGSHVIAGVLGFREILSEEYWG